MGCSASFESASVPQRTGGLGGGSGDRGGHLGARLERHSFGLAVLVQPRRVTVAGSEPSESAARARFGRADGVSEL